MSPKPLKEAVDLKCSTQEESGRVLEFHLKAIVSNKYRKHPTLQ